MKRIEIDTLSPTKSRWEFAIIPNINFGYDSCYSNGAYYISFAWLLWYVIIMIKKK